MSVVTGDFVQALLAADDPPPAAATAGEPGFAIVIKTFVLAQLVERTARVVPAREHMPVLRHLRFEATTTRLRVAATDSEITMICATELVEVRQPGVAYLPAKAMQEIVRAARGVADDTATLTITGLTAVLTIGAIRWQLSLVSGADWPALADSQTGEHHDTDRAAFLTALRSVKYAAARDGRTSLMLVDVRGGRMTASNGVRLQQVGLAAPAPLPVDFPLPIGAVDDLCRLLRDSELDQFSIAVTDHNLIFTVGSDTLIARRLSAPAPDMAAQLLAPALAANTVATFTVARAALADAIRHVRISAESTTAAIVLTLRPDPDATLTVAASDKRANAATETLPVDFTGNTVRTLVVSHQFLTDLLGVADTTTATFHLATDARTRPSALLAREANGDAGLIPQMRADWTTT